MNYGSHYNRLIERARNREVIGYTENHHIIPRCIGGNDEKENLVRLTAREHFVAHVLLVKIYPKEHGLIKAVNMMCSYSDMQEARNRNRLYGWLKERFSREMSRSQTGKGNSQYGKMWIHNLELRESKKINKGDDIPNEWIKGKIQNFDLKSQKILKENIRLIKKKTEYSRKRLIAEYTFKMYIDKKYQSIRDFAKSEYWDKSFVALRNLWTEHIIEYNTQKGKRFIPYGPSW